jgi:dATP/dGTP diphosphohydrolase
MTKKECWVERASMNGTCSQCGRVVTVRGRVKHGESQLQTMPADSVARKNTPLATGVLDYFPAALAAVARISKVGNDKHNPGEPLHWSRGKSQDHADCVLRHLADRGVIDPETGESHTAEMAWRALALLQLEEEERGAPKARGAK